MLTKRNSFIEDSRIAGNSPATFAPPERIELPTCGFVSHGRIDEVGIAFSEDIENTTNELSERVWRQLGERGTLDVVRPTEPVGHRFMALIDATASKTGCKQHETLAVAKKTSSRDSNVRSFGFFEMNKATSRINKTRSSKYDNQSNDYHIRHYWQ